jgi:hypothetical protein
LDDIASFIWDDLYGIAYFNEPIFFYGRAELKPKYPPDFDLDPRAADCST